MRYLVVGYGNIGRKRRAILGRRCVGTVDPVDPEADARTPDAFRDDGYDAAILATPNAVKLDLAARFLARGKHVLVEKPFILGAAAGETLRRAGRDGRAICYTAYNFRFEPHVAAIRELLETEALGPVYGARLCYGNGTAGSIAGTWRDTPGGVLEDMATHMIDLTGHLFGRRGAPFRTWERRSHELFGVDHCLLATPDRDIVIESSYLSWRNRWRIEVTGRLGSIEMDGLTKWGRSELVVRRRRWPSGEPDETRTVALGPDPTWAADLEHFEGMAIRGESSLDNDLWISRVVMDALEAKLD